MFSRISVAVTTYGWLPLGLAVACGSNNEGTTNSSSPCEPSGPAVYESEGWDGNVAVELDVIARFNALLQPMKDAEASATILPTAASLMGLFDAGEPSLKSLTTPYYATQIENWLSQFEMATGKSFSPAEPPPSAGGIWEQWIFNERGTDLRQAIEKGMYGAMHYAHAAALATDSPDAASVDRMLAIYGAHPSFPHDDQATSNPDRFTAQYATRRDDVNRATPGLYRKIKSAFIGARSAAAVGEACSNVRDSATGAILDGWERVLFATVIYYANDATKKIATDPPTDALLASGLHGLGEATGFVHGFRQMATASRHITDAQIDELLELLNASATGPVNTYRFATDAANELPKLEQVIGRIQTIYGFSDVEIEDFKTNY